MKKYISMVLVWVALLCAFNGVAQETNAVVSTNIVPVVSTNIVPVVSTNAEPPVVSTNVVPVVSTNAEPPAVSTNVVPAVALVYVQKWPRPLMFDGSVWGDPTPAQCRAAGYELEANRPPPTAEELSIAAAQALAAAQVAAANAAAAQAEQDARNAAILAEQTAKTSRIQAYRDAYANGTGQLCALAGIPVVRVLTMEQIQEAVMPLLDGPYAGMVNGILILLTNLEMKLTKEDGPNALDNI